MSTKRQPDSERASGRPIKVHIERLVLRGFAAHDRRRIAQGIQQEVARVLAQQGLPSGVGAIKLNRLDGGEFRMRAGAKPEQTGRQIGQRVHAGLRRAAVSGS